MERRKPIERCSPITIGEDCWLGGGVTICPGVIIGDRCIIGAGSVVVKDIPSDSIAVGNPCKVIKSIEGSHTNGIYLHDECSHPDPHMPEQFLDKPSGRAERDQEDGLFKFEKRMKEI